MSRAPHFKFKRPSAALIIACLALFVAIGGGAYAAGLINGHDIKKGTVTGKTIKNSSVTGKDIKSKSVPCKDLKKGCVAGPVGADGPQGTQGPEGPQGAIGPATPAEYTNPHWGPIARNNIGSPTVQLVGGPYGSFGNTGPLAAPPYGVGSLNLGVSDEAIKDETSPFNRQEKASFGNEVDFLGDDPTAIDELGYQVFQTGENAGISARNVPNITFELDPNVGGASNGVNYTSLVYVPDAVTFAGGAGWSGYIDATEAGDDWYFTNGTLGTQTGCTQATRCDWDQIKTALTDSGNPAAASIYTLAVGIGRDNAYFGNVDGLRVNSTIYDFEPFGVQEVAVP